VAQVPRTRYAQCGDIDIAYQVFGDGPVDLVVLPGPFIPIDSIDAEPSMYRFYRRLASFARVIRFDQRGMGLSSRLPSVDAMGPKFWAEDAIAVMDAVGCERATLFGSSFFSMSGLVLAADYPERVRSLVIVNGAARVLWGSDYEVGVLAAADVRDKLASITAPTLILHRADAAFVASGHGRYLAEHIQGARYVELPGADSLHWVGETATMLDEIEEFITGVRGGFDAERVLTTIVFTDIVGSTQHAATLGDNRWHDLLDNHDNIVRHELERYRGREVNTAGDGFVATFTSPSVAIDCAEAILDAVRSLGIEVRAGIHAGEVEVRGADIAGMAVHIGARVAALAGPSEVLVSSTVREIVTGSRRQFVEHGDYELRGVPGRWRVYALVRSHVAQGTR
jgi:class 3 adenylate cyclase